MDYSFNYSREDIEWLADELSKLPETAQKQQPVDATTIDLSQLLDLRAMASAVAGVTDPIGQLKDWLYGKLSEFVQTIINAVSSIFSEFYDRVIKPALDTIAGALNTVANTMQSWFQSIADSIFALSAAIQQVVIDPIMNALHWVQENFPSFIESISNAVQSIESAISSIADTISSAVQQAVQSLQSIPDVVSGIVASIAETLSSIPDKISDVLSTIADTVSSALQPVMNIVSQIGDAISGLASRISDALSSIRDTISSAVSGIVDIISSVKDTVASFMQGLVSEIQDRISGLVSAVADAASSIANALSSIPDTVRSIISNIADAASSIVSSIVDALSSAKDTIMSALGSIGDAIRGLVSRISDAASTISNILSSIVSSISDALGSVRDTISSIVSGIVDTIRSTFSNLVSSVQNIASAIADAVSRLPDTVRSAAEAIVSRVRDLASAVADALSGVADRVRDLASSIVDAVSGMLDQLRSRIADLASAVSSAASSIADTLSQLPQTIANAVSAIVDRVASAASAVGDAIRGIVERVQGAASSIVDALQSALSGVADRVRGFVSTIADALSSIRDKIAGMVSAVADAVSGFVDRIRDALSTVRDALSDVAHAVEELPSRIADLASSIKDTISSIVSSVTDALSKLPSMLSDALDTLRKAVTGVVDHVRDAVLGIADRVRSALEDLYNRAAATVSGVVDTLQSAIGKLVDAVKTLFKPTELAYRFAELLKTVDPELYSELVNLLTNVTSPIDAVKHIPSIVFLVSTAIPRLVWRMMPDSVKQYFENLADTVKNVGSSLKGFINAIMKFPEWFPNWFREHIASPITGAIKTIGEPLSKLADALNQLGGTLKDKLSRFLEDPGGTIASALKTLLAKLAEAADWIGDHVIVPIARAFGKVLGKFSHVIAEIAAAFISGEASGLPTIIEAVSRPTVGFVFMITKVVPKIVEKIRDAFDYISEKLADFFLSWLPQAMRNAVETVKDSLEKVGGKIVAFMKSIGLLSPVVLFSRLASAFYQSIHDSMPAILDNPVAMLYALFNVSAIASAIGVVAVNAIRSIASLVRGVKLRLGASAGAEGGGASSGVELDIALGLMMESLAKHVEMIMPDITRYIMIGHMIWWAEPTRAITRYWLTQNLTIELPPMEQTLRSLRRHLVTPLAPAYYRTFVEQLRMGGIGQKFIDTLYPLTDELLKVYHSVPASYDDASKSIIIVDRFGQPRVFPVSLVAEIPTASELATMMIRDIILDPKDFAAAMAMHGYTPDTAFMFYLLHYRYPSPEKLSDFFWRGIAGELWNPDESYDESIARTFFKQGQPPKPVAPRRLNFAADQLFEIMRQYMKWHDYARIPWRPGWPTDNAIIMDLIADIPGKIELRWMTRWGMFDYWGAYGATPTTTIEEITKGILAEGSVASAEPMYKLYTAMLSQPSVVFDVQQFARALQSTGLHPYWVPWVTVAETINALSEERTYLRTGFINLFKEGLFTLDDMNKLLAGFFTVVFRTAYFDPVELKWKSVDIEYPVAFLPAESKLLELRAVMDKALDIYREAYRRIARAISTNALSVDEAKQKLAAIVEDINKSFFTSEIERITGKTYKLAMDEGYWSAWSSYASTIQNVEAVERTRYYARYIIWNVLWALRYGYTTIEEAEEWVDSLVQSMHEHPKIRDMIEQAVDFMLRRFNREIAVRAVINKLRSRRISVDDAVEQLEKLGFDKDTAKLYIDANVYWYTPSIVTYASMLEVVPEATPTVVNIVEHMNMPEDESSYWTLYLLRQPVRDELTLVRTRVYQLLALGMKLEDLLSMLSQYSVGYIVTDNGVKQVLGDKAKQLIAAYDSHASTLQAYGISPMEWVLYNLIAEMEAEKDRLREAAKERTPSPSTLATLSEYLVLPEELVKKALDAYHVPDEWKQIWLQYIEVKPLKSDYKSLLSVYIRAFRYGAVTRDEVEKFIKELSSHGFTPKEIELIKKRIDLEEEINEVREAARLYIPTPTMLATLSEYMELPEDKIKKALTERHVPSDWQNIWLKYIRVRPIKSDYKSLLSVYIRAFRYGAVAKDELDKFIKSLKNYGFTSKEIEAIKKRAALEEAIITAREAARLYIPTPTMLATLSEYMELPDKLISAALDERNVPDEWKQIWLKYIRVRPLKSDYKQLFNVYIRALRYGVVTSSDVDTLIDEMKNYGFTSKEIEILRRRTSIEEEIVEAREAARLYIPTPSMLATLSEYMELPIGLIEQALEKRRVPLDWRHIWLQYIKVRPVKSDYKSLLSVYIRALRYGAVTRDDVDALIREMKNWGFTPKEIELIERRVNIEEAIAASREYLPTPYSIATLSEYMVLPEELVSEALERRRVPEEWRSIWLEYIRVRPLKPDYKSLLSVYIRAFRYGAVTRDEVEKFLEELSDWGFTPKEIELVQRRVDLEEAIAASREYLPTPFNLATLSEYLVLPSELVEEVLRRRHVPERWMAIWLEYIRVRPVKSDYKQLFMVYLRGFRYGVVSRSDVEKLIEELSDWGFTPKEIELLQRRVDVEEAIAASREYLPTPFSLATLSEYLVLPRELVEKTLERRRVPEEWRQIWLEYIRVRPLKSDYRQLLTAYLRGLRYGVVSRDEVEKLLQELADWGFTPKEIELIERRVNIDEAIAASREYIPTPSMLASMAEYVPAVRRFLQQVLEKRRVPREWWRVWMEYVHLRPLSSEVREVIRDIRQLYEYFAVKLDDLRKALRQFIRYGLEEEEIELLVYGSRLRASLRAYRELVGTPRQLVTLAEYSPQARRVALAQVYKMIDALPVDQQTKEFLKKMWEEYIRVKPVYDEVKRYITELISDYANGLMTDDELRSELEALKDWGIDDYEIQFYMWLAQRRRIRYAYREMMRQQYYSGYGG